MQIPTDEQVLRLKAQTLKARGLEPLEHILRAGKCRHIGERAGWPDRTTQAISFEGAGPRTAEGSKPRLAGECQERL